MTQSEELQKAVDRVRKVLGDPDLQFYADMLNRLCNSLEASEREADRLRHGDVLESDFICPNELLIHELNKKLSEGREEMLNYERRIADITRQYMTEIRHTQQALASRERELQTWKELTSEAQLERDHFKEQRNNLSKLVNHPQVRSISCDNGSWWVVLRHGYVIHGCYSVAELLAEVAKHT